MVWGFWVVLEIFYNPSFNESGMVVILGYHKKSDRDPNHQLTISWLMYKTTFSFFTLQVSWILGCSWACWHESPCNMCNYHMNHWTELHKGPKQENYDILTLKTTIFGHQTRIHHSCNNGGFTNPVALDIQPLNPRIRGSKTWIRAGRRVSSDGLSRWFLAVVFFGGGGVDFNNQSKQFLPNLTNQNNESGNFCCDFTLFLKVNPPKQGRNSNQNKGPLWIPSLKFNSKFAPANRQNPKRKGIMLQPARFSRVFVVSFREGHFSSGGFYQGPYITHFGRMKQWQMYGHFQGLPLQYGIVWVGVL